MYHIHAKNKVDYFIYLLSQYILVHYISFYLPLDPHVFHFIS